MKYFYLILILLAACATRKDELQETADLPDTMKITTQPDSVTTETSQDIVAIDESEEKLFTKIEAKKFLVDKVYYFPLTQEAYVWVGFKEGYDWKALDSVKVYADSIVYEDGETTRTRYPMQKAKEYFNLDLLDGISIFNESHVFQSQSKIKRIEYFQDVLGDQMIAILETPKTLKGEQFYGINGTTDFMSTLSSQVINDEKIRQSVIDFINQPSEYDWEFESTYIEPFNTTYSFYSFAAEGNSERSYIVESSDKGMIKLAETNNEYSIWELSPVKIQVNNHPVLLLWLGYPETDIEWYSPAVFDGSQFIITNDRIIDLTKFQINEEASN